MGAWSTRFTIPHLRLVAGGWLGSTSGEIWACGIKLVAYGAGEDSQSDISGDQVTGAIGNLEGWATTIGKPAWVTLMGALMGNEVGLTYIKLNAFGPGDVQQNDPTVDVQFAAITGGATNTGVPWSSAVNAEHRTSSRSRGIASRGRLSLPAAFAITPSTGQVSTVGTGSLAAAAATYATFLGALNMPGTGGETFYPSIVGTTNSGSRPPLASKIESAFISSVPGETRSRQSKLNNSAAAVAVSY